MGLAANEVPELSMRLAKVCGRMRIRMDWGHSFGIAECSRQLSFRSHSWRV